MSPVSFLRPEVSGMYCFMLRPSLSYLGRRKEAGGRRREAGGRRQYKEAGNRRKEAGDRIKAGDKKQQL